MTKEEKIKVTEEQEKENKKRKYIIIILLLLLLCVFGISVTYGKDIYKSLENQIIETFHSEKPSSPVIEGGNAEWATERIIKVKKDAYTKNGLEYYEYCITGDKSTKECNWKKTETKNVKVVESGIYYVTFRAIDKAGKIGNESNTEVVYIDNNNPVIKNVKIKEVSTNSIQVEVEANDELSGIKSYLYSLDGENYEEGKLIYTYSSLESNKVYIIYVKVVDKVGNATVLSMEVSTSAIDNTCDLNCDTDGDGKCDLNCDTNGDGTCDLNCDTNGDGTCDLNCSNDEVDVNPTPSTTPAPTDKPEETSTPSPSSKPDEEEEEKEIPVINLDKVPVEFIYGEKYELPSYVDFGSDSGTYECIIEGKEYTDTSTLGIGKHLIVCTVTSSKNVRVMVEKTVNVKVEEGEEEVWDGWIRLNLYYPDNSTNWQWRIAKEGEIRDGYENSGWQDYTGPILVKLEDVDDVYIRYDLLGETYVVAPSGKIVVDIEPEKYTLKSGETTKVNIYYDKDVISKEYKIGSGEWQEYTGSFEVGVNTLIEARAVKEEKVYDSEGNYLYTSKRTGVDSIFISEYVEGTGNGSTGNITYQPVEREDGTTTTTPTTGSKPSTYLTGPVISSNPSSELVDSVKISVIPQEVAEKIYISIGNGSYQEYTGEIDVTTNTIIKAYYIRYSDGKISDTSYYYVQNIQVGNKPYVRIDASPTNYLTETQERVEVSISGSNYDTLEYSFDGVIYQSYAGPITITESSTIYAKGTNREGSTIEKLTIPTTTAPTVKETLTVHIGLDPDKSEVEGLVNKTKVSIDYDSKAEKKYYKIGYYGEWQEYTGPFEVTSNTTVYGYCTSSNGLGNANKSISFLTMGISDPIITGSPTTGTQQVKIEIEYDKNAEIMRYQVGNGPMLEYNGAFYVYENTEITAYNKDVLGNEAESKYQVNNIVDAPRYTVLDKGMYYIIKLNYPSTSTEEGREYKWKQDGNWKVYNSNGILLIKPEYKDEIIDGTDGVTVEDENGRKITFTDHYYILDVPISELMENLFMRWDTVKVKAPQILVNPNSEPTKEVEVGILYSSSLIKKYYKTVTEDGIDSGWKEYTGPFEIKENNVVIYAKGTTINNNDSEISSVKVTNVDLIGPEITVKGDFETPKKQVTLTVNAKDNMMMYMVKWEKGEQTTEYFKDNGISMRNNGTFKVEENGKYTIYAVDQVGNETVKVIEVTNIDQDAPDIIINVLTERFGTSAEVSIDYGDSITKEYRVGETSTNYQTYTDTITISSYDVYDLANEDGSLTIYAKGVDEAGNIEEVSETIYILDLDIPASPIIDASTGYPTLTEYGVILDDILTIVYDNRDDIINYISLDGGTTWSIYTGYEHVSGSIVMAKSVKKESGLTVISSGTIKQPSDALPIKLYDGSTSTSVSTPFTYKLNIDKSVYNEIMTIVGNIPAGNAGLGSVSVTFYDEIGTQVGSTSTLRPSGTFSYNVTILEDVSYALISSTDYKSCCFYSYHGVVSEVGINTMPTISQTNISYPILSSTSFKQDRYQVTVHYLSHLPHKLYSLDGGETWKNYKNAFEVSIGDVIKAKSIDSDGTESKVVSHTVTQASDALGIKAYDDDTTTVETIAKSNNKIFYLAEDTIEKDIRFYFSGTIASDAAITVFDSSDNEIESITIINNTIIFNIPDAAYKIKISAGSSALNVSEVNLRTEVSRMNVDNPLIETSNQDKWETTKTVTITYPTGYINEYSLDVGETWIEYVDSFNVSGNTIVLARCVDDNQKVVSSSSFTIVTDPFTLKFGLNYHIMQGDNYSIPASYNASGDGSGVVCTVGDEEITNTSELPIGEYTINCTVFNDSGFSTTFTKDLVVVSTKYKATIVADSILKAISDNDLENGYYYFSINGEKYPVHVYNYDSSQVWDEDMIFGLSYDIGTSTSYATHMVVVKVNGDLTVNEGVTVEPYYTEYGGPKGFTLYVTGTLTNNGRINNSHGAYAEGQNVYLWKNADGTYEYVPAEGAAGGASTTGTSTSASKVGNKAGSDGTNRQTGGGGGGHAAAWRSTTLTSARGGNGTSYSGGSGAGSYMRWNSSYTQPSLTLMNGSDTGGAGGNSYCYWDTSYDNYSGGVGNPGGYSCRNSVRQDAYGTGGLLIIYATEFQNNSIIEANGTSANLPVTGTYKTNAAGSGAGSINIFYNYLLNIGTLNAVGGNGSASGGNGSITYTELESVNISSNYQLANLTTLGLESDYHVVTIQYSSLLSNKLYSLDNGTTWLNYTEPFIAQFGDIILAKGIRSDNTETNIVSYTVLDAENRLPSEVYDNNKETSGTLVSNTNYSFTLSDEVIGKSIYFSMNNTPASDATIKIYNSSNTILLNTTLSSDVKVIKIPANAYKVVINAGHSNLEISEISVRNIDFDTLIDSPLIKTDSTSWTASKIVSITYASSEYVNEYSLDLGETWIKYTDSYIANENMTVLARSIDETGRVVATSSFTITKIDNYQPVIEVDIPNPIIVGTEYNLPTNYSVDNTKSGGNAICKIGDTEITNTRGLEAGMYEITCTVTTGSGIENSITKTIDIIENPYMDANTSLTVGTSVEAKDGSKWHVLEDSSIGTETVVLLSDYNLNSDGTYDITCGSNINSNCACSTVAFDLDNTNIYDETDFNNVGYFIKNTYEPLVVNSLIGTTDVTLPTAEQIVRADGQTFNQGFVSLTSTWLLTTNYWTKTASTSTDSLVWYINGPLAYISDHRAEDADNFGVRPVITTSKTNLLKEGANNG